MNDTVPRRLADDDVIQCWSPRRRDHQIVIESPMDAQHVLEADPGLVDRQVHDVLGPTVFVLSIPEVASVAVTR